MDFIHKSDKDGYRSCWFLCGISELLLSRVYPLPTVTRNDVFMLCLKMEENFGCILSMGLGSSTWNRVWSDLCDCWNVDLSVVAQPQLYFLSKAALCAVHAVTTITLWSKRSHWFTLEFTGPQTSAEVSNELKQPFQHLLFLVMVPVEMLGTASWSFQGNSLFT